jgi:hypothetical protein
MKRNDEGRQRILALLKKQRSLSSSPTSSYHDGASGKSFTNISDEERQPDLLKDKDQYDSTKEERINHSSHSNHDNSTESMALESPNTTQRNQKKRRWIQKRARAVREVISPQKLTGKDSLTTEEESRRSSSLKRQSDSSTEPDDSYESESDDNSCTESLDSDIGEHPPTPMLDCPSSHNKEPLFTLQDVKFISDEFDSHSDEMQFQNNTLGMEYPSDEKSVAFNAPPDDSLDVICSSDSDSRLLSSESYNKSCQQNQGCDELKCADEEVYKGNAGVVMADESTLEEFTTARNMDEKHSNCDNDVADSQSAIREWDTSGVIFTTFHETVEQGQNCLEKEDAHRKSSEEFSVDFDKLPPAATKDSAMRSLLSSEEARLNSMLQTLSKKTTDEQVVIRTNWWDDESKLASLASPRSASIGKTKDKRRDTFDNLFQSVSSFFEDLKLNCSVHLCSDIDDRIGHEIDVNDGLQSMVEDDITFDFNSMLMNSSTATGYQSKSNKAR